ncbi:conserved hypothetical protein [Hyphomicrobium denitrificans ATCC 51888]|uniref:site-specific DNA-methyltransferase (adenine-specific) n=1 Tax=Hyphomicrobium denitrificans (strain ATCC 51888 / DSM 1869 / NCIMB 11706 / TK 0415) TaxID=582899 RepID=D8JUD6_HYPDA|nr:hypothetical protein [Hyphomicrobium denitrificans]ADJ22726.1 conserved hypothetical protein [Hyphomicrobium denitrificans ATCC 51888]
MPEFLEDLSRRPLAQTASGLVPYGVFIGPGQLGLEVAVYMSPTKPNSATLLKAWKERRDGRSAPVLTVALRGGRAWLCGPSGESLPVYADKDAATIERLCAAALKQPDRHAALLFLGQALPSLDTVAPGLRNEGLFALHELTTDAPTHPDWQGHIRRARTILQDGAEGRELLRRLGYSVEKLDNVTHVLKGADRRLALAILLDRSEVPEAGSQKFGNLSPVSYALTKADQENLDWVLVTQGDRLRLYPTKGGVGVGRRGRSETYIEVQTTLLADEQLAFLPLLFAADALKPGGSVARLLDNSKRFAANLATRLRDRIYNDVMPLLAQGVAAARGLKKPTADDLDLTYRMALTVLFRLLFVAYAEDRDLLPYRHSEAYRRRSLKQKALELAEHAHAVTPISAGTSHWTEVARIWNAVSVSDVELSVPAYNGGLFTKDPAISPAGAELAKIALPNEIFEPALKALLLSDVGEGLQPVDFRSLGVREFGTIYEGLLESELSVADQHLDLDRNGSYIPSKGRQTPIVRKGEIYLHDMSGARKASGSYFTKSFAVEHLLDRALVPALDDHLARVLAMDDADAAEAFFDFRVADIAMGSGHFLVAAVDRIEKSFTGYLAKPGAPGTAGIRNELGRLKEAAKAQLGELADQMTFEDSQLLRRLIARRCIYGVDLNPLSVELARLAIWIHTFVPGLPLSVLDHNLVNGNALVGVGTVAEIREAFKAASTALFPVDADNLLGRAAQHLRRLANISDATMADVSHARDAIEEAKVAVADTKALCDIIAAQRLDPTIRYQFENWETDRDRIQKHPARFAALTALEGLKTFHFPIAFPEVFLRKRSGFDVLLGNPPWQEATIEDHAFWARHFPGLRGLSQAELERERVALRTARPDLAAQLDGEVKAMAKVRKALTSGAFPGMGTGDPDFYKAFMWRFWNLSIEEGGAIGIVLPRSATFASGSAAFRTALFAAATATDLTLLVNKGEWVFEQVHEQYAFALLAILRGVERANLLLRGPYASLAAFDAGQRTSGAEFAASEILEWNDTASLPLLPAELSLNVFTQLRRSPRLDARFEGSWRARPDRELDATNQKDLMIFADERPTEVLPIFKGGSFNLWAPDGGSATYYAWAEPDIVGPWLYRKRLRSGGSTRDSVHAEFPLPYRQDRSTQAYLSPRIAFRDATNRLNVRTLISCLVPPNVFLTNKAPYLLWPSGDQKDEAYLLGILSSYSLDWYARRFVERNVNYFLFNPLPIPRPAREDPLWQRAVALAGRLAAPDERFAEWAKKVGVEWGPLPPKDKQSMIDELDAVVAHLYGLTEDQLRHIFETFHEGWAWQERFAAVQVYFQHWIDR